MFIRKKQLERQLARAEERAGHHFSKLWNIEKMIENYENSNGLNPHYLIEGIKKELDRPQNQSSSNK